MNPWEELYYTCASCQKCSLADTRTNIVFGGGNPQSSVFIVGEAPGEQEDLQGKPFVGRGGKLLDEMLSVIDLSRNTNVYLSGVVKCRPPKNRDPLSVEQKSCLPYLYHQIHMINPKIIVCLGRIAACALIRSDFKITEEHGAFHEKEGRTFVALYHPAALLRDPSKRPETFADLKKLQGKIREISPETYL